MTPRTPRPPASGLTPDVSRWLDGRASPDEARAVETRLAADPALAAEVADLRAAADTLRADRPAPRPDLADRVLADVAAGRGEHLAFQSLARRYAAAAAVLLAIGVGGSVLVAPADARGRVRMSSDPPGRPAPVADLGLDIDRLHREASFALDGFQPLPPPPTAPGEKGR